MKPAIECKDLTVILGGKTRALSSITVELPAGHIIGLLGPSGAGKTTLIRTIIGRQRPHSGQMTVLGLPAGAKQLRRMVGYMPQDPSIYTDLTVRENLRYFAAVSGAGDEAVDKSLAEVNMTRYTGRLAGNLSGGQRSRVSLAIALLGNPELLVLDEPTVGIDPVLRKQLWELFRKLADRGTTLVVSSHVMDEASHCDTLLLIRRGVILAKGAPKELCDKNGVKTVEEVFLKLVKREAV